MNAEKVFRGLWAGAPALRRCLPPELVFTGFAAVKTLPYLLIKGKRRREELISTAGAMRTVSTLQVQMHLRSREDAEAMLTALDATFIGKQFTLTESGGPVSVMVRRMPTSVTSRQHDHCQLECEIEMIFDKQ